MFIQERYLWFISVGELDLMAKEEIEENEEEKIEENEETVKEEESEEVKEEESEEREGEEEEKDEDELQEDDENNAEDLTPDVDKKLMPSSVILLEESEEYIRNRVLSLKESDIIPGHNDEEGFKRRYEIYMKNNHSSKNQTTLTYFEVNCKIEIIPLKLTTPPKEAMDYLSTYIEKKKAPFNYHPTEEELEEINREKRIAEVYINLFLGRNKEKERL